MDKPLPGSFRTAVDGWNTPSRPGERETQRETQRDSVLVLIVCGVSWPGAVDSMLQAGSQGIGTRMQVVTPVLAVEPDTRQDRTQVHIN